MGLSDLSQGLGTRVPADVWRVWACEGSHSDMNSPKTIHIIVLGP